MKRPLLLLLLSPALLQAKLKLPVIFSDGAVLQQETGAKVWGWSDAGAAITASFDGKNLTTKAAPDGSWSVTFPGLKANATGQELKVSNGKENVLVKDVLVGEVWLASGQSNMEWRVSNSDGAKEEVASAKDPLLRVFVSANVATATPQNDWSGSWNRTQPDKTGNFTAVGYYFGKRIREEV
ncbi:9-O-acetylesterase, partial [Akkermansiaceae bacterium]|nr:9-O-acetylesterase [Akkermansiaceae bacterium]